MATIQCGNVQFQAIKAVLFDKDGTLADSQTFLRHLGRKRSRLIDAQVPGVQEPLLMAFGLDGDQLNSAGLLAVGTRYENEIAAAAYVAETGRDWVQSLSLVRSAFAEADKVFQRKADNTPLFEGVREVLRALSETGISVGIVSADTTENVKDFVERYELGAWVQVSLGVDRGPGKPDPTVFHQACAALNVLPENVLAIGDSAADIEMAKAAKAAGCVAVTWGWTQPTQLHQADALISHLTEIQLFKG
ncbi:HAD family hydrolase [Stenomitos frigidus]|uniref:HAD family hydrolase n=1 Tax=Stenomitos frigidus ULC18 TaxID=2107698 RepID=A0A2T1DZ04_9CYAN|nr:HAD family hydrolase [Stenomitos frigidus]PSB25737.1 HAD family hydrolase [Stenomitos frigidus ULC18]